jgi:cell division protein FtsB
MVKINESNELCPICHTYIHRGEQTKVVHGQQCHISCYNKIKDKMEATPKWKRLFKSPRDYLQAESKNGDKKTIINLNEFSTAALTEEKKILQEGLFRDFIAGLIGFFYGKYRAKKKTDLVIKGSQEQIEALQKELEKIHGSNADKDKIIARLATQHSWDDVKDELYRTSHVRIP